MRRAFTIFLFFGMLAGILVGWGCHTHFTTEAARISVAGKFSLLTDIFLRLIKMVIAPLVLSTLVAGIAHMEDSKAVGRIGIKAMVWFIGAAMVSLLIGLIMVQWLQPGAGLNLTATSLSAGPTLPDSISLQDIVVHSVPVSIADALARNEILQVVVFSVLFGLAMTSITGRAPAVLALVDQLSSIMLKVTAYIMKVAPIAIFSALAATITIHGLEVLRNFALFIGGYYLSLASLWALLLLVAFILVGANAKRLVRLIAQPVLLAFSTASSEAAYPGLLDALYRFGVPKRIVSFVLPLGYSFNLDGSMVYCTFATLFIAQAYNIELTPGRQITLLLMLMLTSKGIAGVPRAALLVVAATLNFFKMPASGLALILAVDHILDMGRSATNVIGNSLAATAVAKWERALQLGKIPDT